MSKKNFCSAVLLFVIAVQCVGQSKQKQPKPPPPEMPDLSGEWVLDSKQSNMDKEIHDYHLAIVHHEPEIKFSKKYWRGKREVKEEVTYYTDGRSGFDPRMTVNDQLETRWRGQKLVRKTTSGLSSSPSGFPTNIKFVSYEEWMISADRQTLIRTITSESGTVMSKAVFTRVR